MHIGIRGGGVGDVHGEGGCLAFRPQPLVHHGHTELQFGEVFLADDVNARQGEAYALHNAAVAFQLGQHVGGDGDVGVLTAQLHKTGHVGHLGPGAGAQNGLGAAQQVLEVQSYYLAHGGTGEAGGGQGHEAAPVVGHHFLAYPHGMLQSGAAIAGVQLYRGESVADAGHHHAVLLQVVEHACGEVIAHMVVGGRDEYVAGVGQVGPVAVAQRHLRPVGLAGEDEVQSQFVAHLCVGKGCGAHLHGAASAPGNRFFAGPQGGGTQSGSPQQGEHG